MCTGAGPIGGSNRWDIVGAHNAGTEDTRAPLQEAGLNRSGGALTFTSVTELDAEHRLLLISERHELVLQGDERVTDYQFVMRCWEREELDVLLARHGFGNIQYFGAYDPGVDLGATDRLVAVVQLSDDADTL